MLTLSHPFVLGPLGGGIVVLLAYLDSKYKDTKQDNETYLKLFIASSLVFSTIVYFSSNSNVSDDFLNQKYDTSNPSLLPKSKGGFSLENQKIMQGPNIKNIMDELPPVGTYSNVNMKIKK